MITKGIKQLCAEAEQEIETMTVEQVMPRSRICAAATAPGKRPAARPKRRKPGCRRQRRNSRLSQTAALSAGIRQAAISLHAYRLLALILPGIFPYAVMR